MVWLSAAIIAFQGFDFGDNAPKVHEFLRKLISGNAWVFALLLAAPIILSLLLDVLEAAGKYFEELSARRISDTQIIPLFAAVRKVVEKKLDRFGKYARELKDGRIQPDKIFSEITQPEVQIEQIVLQLTACVRNLLWSRLQKLRHLNS